MRDLRVYTNPVGAQAPGGQAVFYSRRADGPYYRWRYEDAPGRWRFSRVCLPKWVRSVLCVASWNAVPAELQARIGEHYLE